jgi:hypothetical protein
VVETLVHYLYHFSYEELRTGSDFDKLAFHINMATTADMYLIPALNQLANAKFSTLQCRRPPPNDALTIPKLVDLAYASPHGTECVRSAIVHLVVYNYDLPESQLGPMWDAMRAHPFFWADITLEIQSKYSSVLPSDGGQLRKRIKL